MPAPAPGRGFSFLAMKLLAIETATEACSAALLLDGDIRLRHTVEPRRHAELILTMTEQLLAEASLGLRDLDGIAFGRGPGAFTGVRIAVGVVQGLAFGADLPVVPVSTLQALAQGALRETGHARVLAAIDARMGEVYWGAFIAGEDGLLVPAGEEGVFPPEAVPIPDSGEWFGTGTGWAAHGEALKRRLQREVPFEGERLPSAWDVALLAAPRLRRGEGLAPEQALPVYLRDQVAQRPANP